jgi:hypothetical protein
LFGYLKAQAAPAGLAYSLSYYYIVINNKKKKRSRKEKLKIADYLFILLLCKVDLEREQASKRANELAMTSIYYTIYLFFNKIRYIERLIA